MITLPPEIWLQVLRNATSLPDDFDIRLLRDKTPDALARQLFQPRLAVARTVVCVCKLWDTIGTPFLYESLILSSSTQFDAIVSTLAPCIVHDDDDSDTAGCSGIGDEPDGRTRRRPLASWVKRIIIAIRPPYNATSRSSLRKLFRSCPALSILHVTSHLPLETNGSPLHYTHSCSALFDAVLLTSKTLQILNLIYGYMSYNPEHWTVYFQRMSALRAFRFDDFMDLYQQALMPLDFISMTAESFRSIPFIAPPVKELILREFADAYPIPPSSEFLKRLTLTISSEMDTAEDDLQEIISSVPPSVTHLTVSQSKWADFLNIHELPRTVNHFGMSFDKLLYADEYEDHSGYGDLVMFCESIVGDGLNAIQLMDTSCSDLRTIHADVLELLVETLRRRNITLVDWEGNVMSDIDCKRLE